MRRPCGVSQTPGRIHFGRILSVTAFAVIMIVLGCDTGEDSIGESCIPITNSSSETITIYYAWENDDREVDQQSETIAAGDTHTIRMQTSLYGNGIFSARNASNAFHTYDVQFNETGPLPITISNGDF